jgi:hypothetical protein
MEPCFLRGGLAPPAVSQTTISLVNSCGECSKNESRTVSQGAGQPYQKANGNPIFCQLPLS